MSDPWRLSRISGTCGKTRPRGFPQLALRETLEKYHVSRVIRCVDY